MENNLIGQLVKKLGKTNVLYTPEDLAVYSYDGTFAESLPDVVVLPETTQQVSQVVRLAAETRTPIVPRGMGSGLAAGSIPMPTSAAIPASRHVLACRSKSGPVLSKGIPKST